MSRRTTKTALAAVVVALGIGLATSTASANVVFISADKPQSGEGNIRSGSAQPGAAASGTTGQTRELVDFPTTRGQSFPQPQSGTPGVPELSTWAMAVLGLAGLGFAGFRSTRRKSISIVG
jgi:hypothetical protein